MQKPPRPTEQKVPRWDLRQATRFHRMLEQQPWLGAVLCALSLLAGTALLLGWVGMPAFRADAYGRAWVAAIFWWLFAAYVGFFSVRGWMRRRRTGADRD